MKALYRMNFECGRNGTLSGIFVADSEDVGLLIESKMEISFGEVLGKHSNVEGWLESHEIEKITDDVNVIEVVEKYGLSVGHNPFNYPVEYSWKESKGWDDDILVCEGIELLKKGC